MNRWIDRAPYILLLCLLLIVFGVPFLPLELFRLAYLILISFVTLGCVFVLKKGRNLNLIVAIVLILLRFIFYFNDLNLGEVQFILASLFFLSIVIRILWQIASEPQPTELVILDSINGYFLLGLISAMIIGLTHYYSPGSFTFSFDSEIPMDGMSDYVYFSLITFATVGYGDIVPRTAEAKAVSNLVSVSGQLYVAIVMAMMIGNHIARKRNV